MWFPASPRNTVCTGWCGFEAHEDFETARLREKRLKEWKRNWKIELVERENPHWLDLYRDFHQ
jgi:putative endonuclease